MITSMGLFWGVSGVDLIDFRGSTRFIFFWGNESRVEARRGIGPEGKLATPGRMNVHTGMVAWDGAFGEWADVRAPRR